jgi:aminomethyltransferase
MTQRTCLCEWHRRNGARLVDFAGWEMPLHYGSQLEEHHAVRRDAGMFDVSHMTRVDLEGAGAEEFLRRLLANDVARIAATGQALYSCMLNESGGVVDDLIVYRRGADRFRIVVNAATRDKDLAWMEKQLAAFPGARLVSRPDLAMIAVQGPNARTKCATVLGPETGAAALALKTFHAVESGDYFIGRTGYTGEDGFEIILPNTAAVEFWTRLAGAGVAPCGLGARDTLRLEAGMCLYGTDMDDAVTPLECGLAWTVSFDPPRDFIGRAALQAQRARGLDRQLVGLVLEEKGMLRNHQPVECSGARGEITSGSFSPTLGRAIALARVPSPVQAGDRCTVEVRGRVLPARVVKYPFVRQGRVRVQI